MGKDVNRRGAIQRRRRLVDGSIGDSAEVAKLASARAENLDALNADLKAWANSVRNQLRQKLAGYPLVTQKRILERLRDKDNREPLQKSVKTRLLKDLGEINAIRFTFHRHGIFFERGIAGKKSTTERPWLEPVISGELDSLNRILTENYSELLFTELRFLIPGILDKRITVGV